MSPLNFRRIVNGLGATVFLAHISIAILSFVQAPLIWQREDAPVATAFFEGLAAEFPEQSTWRNVWLAVRAVLPEGDAAAVTGFIPLAVATLAFITIYLVFMKKGCSSGVDEERLLLRWAMAFAAASLLSYPVFTQDFWLSAAWGRMIANGQNPYYELFGPSELANLPLDHFPMPMTYGPLWALISGAVMAVFNPYVWGIFIAFKLVLFALWAGALYLVAQITEHLPPRDRALAIIVIGWLPLSVWSTVAEGHNDIALATSALMWFYFLMKNNNAAPFALVAATLCKYGSAPLFLVDLAYSLKRNGSALRHYAGRLLVPSLFALILFGSYFRSLNFFDGVIEISTWKALRIVDAIAAMENVTALSLAALQLMALAFFPIFAAYKLYQFVYTPNNDAALELSLAILCAVIFSGVSHLWPWYLIWPLAFAALKPGWWLARFVIGVAVMAPFTLAFWWLDQLEDQKEIAALFMYCGAVLWVLLTRSDGEEIPVTPSPSIPRHVRLSTGSLSGHPSPK